MEFEHWWESVKKRLQEADFSAEQMKIAKEAARIAYEQGAAGVPMDDSIIYGWGELGDD